MQYRRTAIAAAAVLLAAALVCALLIVLLPAASENAAEGQPGASSFRACGSPVDGCDAGAVVCGTLLRPGTSGCGLPGGVLDPECCTLNCEYLLSLLLSENAAAHYALAAPPVEGAPDGEACAVADRLVSDASGAEGGTRNLLADAVACIRRKYACR